jgi:hypothetical protein
VPSAHYPKASLLTAVVAKIPHYTLPILFGKRTLIAIRQDCSTNMSFKVFKVSGPKLIKQLSCLLCLFCLCVIASPVVHAEDKAVVAIHGFDKMSCEDWLSSEGNDDVRGQYVAWIRGIVTGYNFANPDNQVALGRMPGDFTLGLYVSSYCRNHKSTTIAGAAFELIAQKRGASGFHELAQDPVDSDAFHAWLKMQSDDMRGLDIKVLRNIYNKEAALRSAK